MMILAVVLALAFVTTTFAHPLSTHEYATTGFQDSQATPNNEGFVYPQVTTGEKTGVEQSSQIATEVNKGNFVGTSSGVAGVSEGVNQNVEKTGNEGYSKLGQTVQPVATQALLGAPEQNLGVETIPQVGKTGYQGYTSQQYPENNLQNTPVPKDENIFVGVDQKQQPYTENPLLLPIQPLSVVPVNQAGELLRPVIVPAKAINSGRIIIMALDPMQQRNFQDVTITPDKQVPYQQIVQPVTYNPAQAQGVEQANQAYFVQPVEKQDHFYASAQAQPNQKPYFREQTVDHSKNVQQTFESNKISPYSAQQNVVPVVTQNVEKQVPQQPAGYTPGQIELSLPQRQSSNNQPTPEKQGQFQQVSGYTPVQNPGVQPLNQQQVNQAAFESAQKQIPYQQVHSAPSQTVDFSQQQQQVFSSQQPIERQTPYQQSSSHVPVQDQPVVQQVYNLQPEHQQSFTPPESQTVEQQVFEKKLFYQPQPVQTAQYIQPHPEEPVHQPQVSNVQPFSVNQAESQIPNQQAVQPENTAYTDQKTLEPNPQTHGFKPQQAVSADEAVYNFGERIPQNPLVQQNAPTHNLSGVSYNQNQLVNPSDALSRV